MANYYVNKKAQKNGAHEVHIGTCSYLPDEELKIYLGTFETCEQAVGEAKKHFKKSNSCYFCSDG